MSKCLLSYLNITTKENSDFNTSLTITYLACIKNLINIIHFLCYYRDIKGFQKRLKHFYSNFLEFR